jgi:hypothetical protein
MKSFFVTMTISVGKTRMGLDGAAAFFREMRIAVRRVAEGHGEKTSDREQAFHFSVPGREAFLDLG